MPRPAIVLDNCGATSRHDGGQLVRQRVGRGEHGEAVHHAAAVRPVVRPTRPRVPPHLIDGGRVLIAGAMVVWAVLTIADVCPDCEVCAAKVAAAVELAALELDATAP